MEGGWTCWQISVPPPPTFSNPLREASLQPCVSKHALSCRLCAYVARPRAHFPPMECAGALPVPSSRPTSRLLTQRMWCICSGCVLSVVTPLEFCCSHSFKPEEALTAAAARSSWKQLQKCERKERRKGIFILAFFFFLRFPPSLPPSTQPRHPNHPSTRLNTCHGLKNMCKG